MLLEFIEYLKAQLGQPYLWGGQHTKLTPEDYEAIINRKEKDTGGYKDGPTYAQAAIDFCRKKFEAGAKELYAYDCSGLGMWWLHNVKGLIADDLNANSMMTTQCRIYIANGPKKGWWVFRTDDKGRATHVGYMVDDKYLIEAKGRKYGVVKTKFRIKDWTFWGVPFVFAEEIDGGVDPEPAPEGTVVEVIGRSVNVRDADSTKGKVLFTAHRGDKFKFIDLAASGWYHIVTHKGDAYITDKEKYTKLKGEETNA